MNEEIKQNLRHDMLMAEDYFTLSGLRFNAPLLADVMAHKYRSGDYVNARLPDFVRWRERLPLRLKAFLRLNKIKNSKI